MTARSVLVSSARRAREALVGTRVPTRDTRARSRGQKRIVDVVRSTNEHHLVSTRPSPPGDVGDVAQAALADRLGPRLAAATAFATTEHFNLQTARAVTVSEANGRAGIYLAALSSNLIALAFIGQMSRLGTAFYVFALILLPLLAFLGVVTFLRLVQSSIEDIAYAHRIGLLRDFYLRLAPELEPHLVVIRETRSAAPFGAERLAPSTWQLTLTAAGMVAVVNSIVVAACAGLVLQAAGVHPLAIPVACGAVIGAGAFSLHERHHRRARDAYNSEAVDRAAILIPGTHQETA